MSIKCTGGDGGSWGTSPLRDGTPSGDPNLIRLCGAKSRKPGGCSCQVPAMANGRCRSHSGLSTGPRTEEGRARIRAARFKRDGYTEETWAAMRRTEAFIAETRALLAQLEAESFHPKPVSPPRLRLVGGTDWSGA